MEIIINLSILAIVLLFSGSALSLSCCCSSVQRQPARKKTGSRERKPGQRRFSLFFKKNLVSKKSVFGVRDQFLFRENRVGDSFLSLRKGKTVSDPVFTGILNVSFPGVSGEELLFALQDVAVSSGAACGSGDQQPSHVLLALGLDDEMADSAIRFSVGRFTIEQEIDFSIEAVKNAVSRLDNNIA